MTKVPWKGQETSSEVFVATKAGQCVSVNQMISMQVGFIAQLKGTLTRKCYTAATIFVDHYSRLKYVHLMTRLTSEETIEADKPSGTLPSSTASVSSTTTAIMDNFQTMPSKTAAVQRGNVSPSVGSTPTSKTTSQKRPSGTFERAHGSSSFMRANNGRPPSTWPFGHMPSGAPFTSTILHLYWRMVPQG
jgi:hypothetical protein